MNARHELTTGLDTFYFMSDSRLLELQELANSGLGLRGRVDEHFTKRTWWFVPRWLRGEPVSHNAGVTVTLSFKWRDGAEARGLELLNEGRNFESSELAMRVQACLAALELSPGPARSVISLNLEADRPQRVRDLALATSGQEARLAQEQLTELLLRFPVLMHPRLLVHTRCGHQGGGLAPMAHAIAMGQGRLPLPSDPGVGVTRLRAWLKEPCVQFGLRTAGSSNLAGTVAGHAPADAAAHSDVPRHDFLHSLEVAHAVHSGTYPQLSTKRNPYLGRVIQAANAVGDDELVLETSATTLLARSLIGSLLARCPGADSFVGFFARHGVRGGETMASEATRYAVPRLFDIDSYKLALASPDVGKNTAAVIAGLAATKLLPSPRAAAAALVERASSDMALYDIPAHAAHAFVAAVRQAGHPFGRAELDNCYALSSAPNWIRAVEVAATTEAMNQVVLDSGAFAAPGQTADMAPTARRRAARAL